MPTVTEATIDGYASCRDGRCPGYKQEPVKAVRTLTEFSYFDFGGDVPGIERSTELIRFADIDDLPCPQCGNPRLVSEQVRPIYDNISGQPQDALLHLGRQSERIRDVELDALRRDAAFAEMRALLEAQQRQISELTHELAARPRGPGRPRKVEGDE